MFSLIKKILFSASFILFFHNNAQSQENKIEVAKKNIARNEFLNVVATLYSQKNERPEYSAFPVIPNFQKTGTPTVTTTIIGGQNTTIQTITQRYKALKEGSFGVPKFSVTINEQVFTLEKTTITVSPARKSDTPSEVELYEELLATETQDFADIKEDAFFALSTDKKQVFTGEGFTATLALYVAENNKADLDSYKQSEQLTHIISKLKPDNCWEEDFGIQEYEAINLKINNKKYNAYIFYKATFFPFNTKAVSFPAVGLTMIKYKITAGGEKKPEYATFYTLPQKVLVKDLPPHPLKEKISVGVFQLSEEISETNLKTGKSFRYNFRISGSGNFSSINLPASVSDTIFDIYPPQIQQITNYSGTQISGLKMASFQILCKKTGKYALRDYFQWIFFNLQKQNYDTLKSGISISVSGESLQSNNHSVETLEPVYTHVLEPSLPDAFVADKEKIKYYASLLLIILLIITLVFTFVRK
jgi:hypothetical protein